MVAPLAARPRARLLITGFATLLGASIACNVFTSLDQCDGDSDCAAGSTCDPQGKFCLARDGGPREAGADAADGGSSDAAPDVVVVPACDPTKPFQGPQLVKGLESEAVFSARFTQGESVAYLSALEREDGSVEPDLYTSTRDGGESSFGALFKLQVSEPGVSEYWPTVTADEKFMFFESDRNAMGTAGSYVPERSRIWFSTKSFTFEPATLQGVFTTTTSFIEGAPYLDPQGRAIYFMSAGRGADGGGDLDLYESLLEKTGAAGPPTSLGPNINTDRAENVPVVSADQLTLYFARANDVGVFDIWTSKRASPSAPFGAASIVGGLDTPYEEFPSYVSDDACRLYLVSNRPLVDGGATGLDTFRLYLAQRPR
ncbi:MAG TPA: hypothetical protein VLT33_25365 [Labilithrix sp.]|nr:hypothetical protein [Labilithrix sp.]